MLLNGNIVQDGNVVLDSGFYFGRGLFETMMVKDAPLFLGEHLERINRGLPLLGINKEISEAEVMDAVRKLQCRDCVLKMVVTEKNTLFTARENSYTAEHYRKGFKVKISSVRRNESSPLTYLKSLNYLENILEHEKCADEGYGEVLFLNCSGKIAEGSVSNVFFIKDNKIFTPSVGCGLLDGIVRKFVIGSFDVTEGKFSLEELLDADGVFLTNSVMGIMKVSGIYGKYYGENFTIDKIKGAFEKKSP